MRKRLEGAHREIVRGFGDGQGAEPAAPPVSILNVPRRVLAEADACAREMLLEIAGKMWGGRAGDAWYLCERHGGRPLVARGLPHGVIALCRGEDIWISYSRPVCEVVDALPEELAHRLSLASPRFERLNRFLRHAHACDPRVFHELVAQRFSSLFALRRVDEADT